MESIHKQLLKETLRRINGEGIPRIFKCLASLSEQEVWYRPNNNSNSVGNLILHLDGNVRQWALATLGGKADTRERQAEFDERGPLPTALLIQKMEDLKAELALLIPALTEDQLRATYQVQGFQETGTAILMHITEHFSYHVGQITYFVKMRKDMDMGYYDGQDLDLTK